MDFSSIRALLQRTNQYLRLGNSVAATSIGKIPSSVTIRFCTGLPALMSLMAAVKDIKAGKPVQKRIVTEEGIFPMEVAAKEFPKRKY